MQISSTLVWCKNKTNSKIEEFCKLCIEKEIFVVTAAGNDGPGFGTIGSPEETTAL